MHTILSTVAVGVGATAAMDAWSLLRRRLFALPPPDFALVGRWLGHMRHGRFRHDAIAAAPPLPHERALGWAAHYATGVAFAAALVVVAGRGWLLAPTPAPALAVGLATVAAPWLLMQPGMGAGLAARRTARPWHARGHALLNHAVFGAGLYAAAALIARVTA